MKPCKTLLKVYFLLAPPPPPSQAGSAAALPLHLVNLNILRLFLITIPKPIVSAAFLSFVCPNCFTMHAKQPMMKYKVS